MTGSAPCRPCPCLQCRRTIRTCPAQERSRKGRFVSEETPQTTQPCRRRRHGYLRFLPCTSARAADCPHGPWCSPDPWLCGLYPHVLTARPHPAPASWARQHASNAAGVQAPRIVRNKSHPRSAPAASRCSRSFLEGALGPPESGHTAAGAKRPTPGRAARGRPHGTTAEEQHSHVRGLLCACGGGEAALHLRAPAAWSPRREWSGVVFVLREPIRESTSPKDGTRPRGCPDRCEANDAEPSERASARAQHKCARVHVDPAIGCHGSGSRHRGARRRLSRRVQVAAGASQRRARARECRRGHVAGTTGRGKVVRNRARAGTRKKRTTR